MFISDETIREVADCRRSREYKEYYKAIENTLETLAGMLYLVSDNEETKITLDIIEDEIVCHITYADGGQRGWRTEICYKHS